MSNKMLLIADISFTESVFIALAHNPDPLVGLIGGQERFLESLWHARMILSRSGVAGQDANNPSIGSSILESSIMTRSRPIEISTCLSLLSLWDSFAINETRLFVAFCPLSRPSRRRMRLF